MANLILLDKIRSFKESCLAMGLMQRCPFIFVACAAAALTFDLVDLERPSEYNIINLFTKPTSIMVNYGKISEKKCKYLYF